MNEQYAIYAVITGLVVAAVGAVWLIIAAFRERTGWGFAVLLLPVLGAVLFIFNHARRCTWPIVLLLTGGLIVGGTIAADKIYAHFAARQPRDKNVEGDRHLTLTGVADVDYSTLADEPDVVVLQIANQDVTDATLAYLKHMHKLRELDLNYTQVSDAGLKVLADLPELKILRLRKTAVTDDGFRAHLANKASLLELDARETQIASKTLREWKAKRPEERKYLK